MSRGISLHVGINVVDPARYASAPALVSAEADATSMEALAKKVGYATTKLLGKAATRDAVLGAIRGASAELATGDILLVTYAGHGGQIVDLNGDEDDGWDETWCLYDGQLVDDELDLEWTRFAAGVRILVVSDSCHSGTVTRFAAEALAAGGATAARVEPAPAPRRIRAMPHRVTLADYAEHSGEYVARLRGIPADIDAQVRASVVLLAACRDDENAGDGDAHGLFTEGLLGVWNDGQFVGDYYGFIGRIASTTPGQSPQYLVTGAGDAAFAGQRPFAIAVESGSRAAAPSTGSAGGVYRGRFISLEHKAIGDVGARMVIGELGAQAAATEASFDVRNVAVGGMQMSFGDMVALAGDYFGDFEQLASLAARPAGGVGTRDEVSYALVVEVWGEAGAAPRYGDDVATAVDRRGHALDARNRAHFLNPDAGDLALPPAKRNRLADASGRPIGAGSSYVHYHGRALAAAWAAGRDGKALGDALAVEAFGGHFLTDAFAAGHLRTARAAIQDHWNRRVPDFFARFKRYMAQQIATQIKEHHDDVDAPLLVWMWPRSVIEHFALSSIDELLAKNGIPDFGFGDLVSLAVHDYDNRHGVLASVAGEAAPVELFGDGELIGADGQDRPQGEKTMQIAARAVARGILDVEAAYRAGRDGTDFATLSRSLVDAAGTWEAERMLPVPLPDAQQAKNPSLEWDQATWQELFADARMQEALAITGANQRDRLQAMANRMRAESRDDEYQRNALVRGVVEPLGRNPVQFLRQVLS